MPTPRDFTRRPTRGPTAARDRFTNRVEETARFLQLLNAPEGSPLPLLMFYGVGGAGKSTLLQHLQGKCDELNVPWARADLAEARFADQALSRMATQLSSRHGMRFDSFKRVLAVLASREPGDAASAEGLAGRTALQVVDLTLDGLALVPVVGQLALMAKLGKGSLQLAFNRAMERPAFREAVLRLGKQEELLELMSWSEEELRTELLSRFAQDLTASLERRGSAGRGVLFLDTHETLWRDAAGGAYSEDGWIRELREFLHDRGVLLVMAGRDALRWTADWFHEDEQGRRLWLEEHRVGGLSRRDALEFLHRADVTCYPDEPTRMPEELREAILRVTDEGLPARDGAHHCYLLTLCAEIVANVKARAGEYPSASDFATLPGGDAAAEKLAARFLQSLHSQRMVSWMEELALTPRFDEEFALALDEFRRLQNGRAGWDRLRQLSLLEEREDGLLEMHRLLRDALRARVSSERARLVDEWASMQWSRQAGEEDWVRRGLAWSHRRRLDLRAALEEYEALRDAAARGARTHALKLLAGWWRDVDLPERALTEEAARDHLAYATTLWRLHWADRGASLSRAIVSAEAALRFYVKGRRPKERARAQGLLGVLHASFLGEHRPAHLARALDCLETSVAALDRDTCPEEWARLQHNLGACYQELLSGDRASHLVRAITCYQEALSVFTEHERPRQWATTLNNLGSAHAELADLSPAGSREQAIQCFTHALRVLTEAEHPAAWAMVQYNLGRLYRQAPTGNRAEDLGRSAEHFTNALRVYAETDLPAQWGEVQRALAGVYRELAEVDGPLHLERAVECYRAALRVCSQASEARQWAALQHSLGLTYLQLPGARRAADLARAVQCFRAALQVYRERETPVEWGRLQHLLGECYRELLNNGPPALLKRSVDHYHTALRARPEAEYPAERAESQVGLGLAFQRMGVPQMAREAFAEAAACYRAAGDGEAALRADALAAAAGEEARAEAHAGDYGERVQVA